MSGILWGIGIGLLVQTWTTLLVSGASAAALIGWWRIFFAIRRLTGAGQGPQLMRDARNIALTSGSGDDVALAREILATRVLPPVAFGNYFAAFWFELLPMLLIAAVIFALRRYAL